MNTKANAAKIPATKNDKVIISLNHVVKENVTANKLKKEIAAKKRQATNEAGKILVGAMKEQLYSLPIIRQIFKDLEFIKRKNEENGEIEIVKDSQGLPLLGESAKFCEALNYELDKAINVDSILKIPMREYLDYITEIEAMRQNARGITIAEFRNVILRYFRNEKKSVNFDDNARAEILRQYTRNTEI